MRGAVSAILLLLLVFQAFYSLTVVTYFYANRPYIASVLCENRNKPESGCKGSCYLNKQLSKAQDTDSQEAEVSQKVEILPYLLVTSPNMPTAATESIPAYSSLLPSFYSHLLQVEFFHPPQEARHT